MSKATDAELTILHKTIKKSRKIPTLFFQYCSPVLFMIAVNELSDLKSHKKEILEPLLILLASYAPHIAEELWHQIENNGSVINASFPVLEMNGWLNQPKLSVAINGKQEPN